VFSSFLPFAAAIFSLVLAFAGVLRKKKPSPATWCFSAGMAVLAIDSLLAGFSLRAVELTDALRAATLALIARSFVPAVWLGFSIIYSRGDFRDALKRVRIPLAVVSLLPVGLSLIPGQPLLVLAAYVPDEQAYLRFTLTGKLLNAVLLIAFVWVLMNLEQTFRSAVGTLRWRIKYVVLGLAVIFGARLYVRSQALLFSAYDASWTGIEAGGLLIGCVFLVVAWVRTGFAEIDLYPSRAVLRSSLTVLIAGGYLFIVGILADVVRRFGGAESLEFQSFVVLLGMAGLAVLLLSDRLRQRVQNFVGRHFSKAQHDSVRIWTEFSRRLANVRDQAGLCAVSARLISDTFEVLSVTIWLIDEQKEQLTLGASTATQPDDGHAAASAAVAGGLRGRSSPFDLEAIDEPWAEELRQLNSAVFAKSGNRWCIPLRTGEQTLGVIVLADRINGAGYTVEQLHLLQCIADQVTSVLLNLRLANEVGRARELEAFRTMSAFFVHDLKNTAASLNLMLRNLPVHFDDPAFRDDALRAIGNTAKRIDDIIGRLTTLRQRPELRPVEADLNQLVNEALEKLDGMPQVQLTKEMHPVPTTLADRDQMQSVVTNLVLNARDAVGPGGQIRVCTEHVGGNVVLSVTDNGCGMTAAFVKESLFRPFQSTKKRGLGIGMFQSRMIVEAHGGNIRVETETGKGSTFRVSLPVKGMA
jgi:putative PEP-CTERM system histidine kinase